MGGEEGILELLKVCFLFTVSCTDQFSGNDYINIITGKVFSVVPEFMVSSISVSSFLY